MTDPTLLIKKIRNLNLALLLSGAVNIGMLAFLLIWSMREHPPTPYCELKPASTEEQQIPLADERGVGEMLIQLSDYSFPDLIKSLSNAQLIENGFAERDLALACLAALHQFDLERALSKQGQTQQKRLLAWKPKGKEQTIYLEFYPDFTDKEFDQIILFAKREKWPFKAEGLFKRLKEQKKEKHFDEHLLETFILTPEFWTLELIFNRTSNRATNKEILAVTLDGDWPLFKHFVDQQRQIHDLSDARRQKFLMDYLKVGSPNAALLLLKTESEFAQKKLDDSQVIAILNLMPKESPEALQFAKEMLASPRSANVWRKTSDWLYSQAGEELPPNWSRYAALVKFVPDKASLELVSKPQPLAAPAPIEQSLPIKKNMAVGKSSPKVSSNVLPILAPVKPEPKKVPPPQTIVYVVQEGDTLWKISQKYGIKVDEIKKANQLKSDILKKGMSLKISKR